MNILFLFLDGVGLGPDDEKHNPFSTARLPNLHGLLDGHPLVLETIGKPIGSSQQPVDRIETPLPHSLGSLSTQYADLIAIDANLGVSGIPQSATGQATILTGKNIPALIGRHYGPKPNSNIAESLETDNLFKRFKKNGEPATFLNAYPPNYFKAIERGLRLPGAIAMAYIKAGYRLQNLEDLANGFAISADFSSKGLVEHLGINGIPIITEKRAGRRMAEIAGNHKFSFFEFWLSDYAGHKQDMQMALQILSAIDEVIGGLLDQIDPENLIIITSDHGNLEDLSTRRHTRNPVPFILIGTTQVRKRFRECLLKAANQGNNSDDSQPGDSTEARGLDLSHIAPAILTFSKIA